jgi:hypothetical protein
MKLGWFASLFKGTFLALFSTALAVGMGRARMKVANDKNLTPEEKAIVNAGLDNTLAEVTKALDEALSGSSK